MSDSAQDIIKALSMQPHPEGGWYVETWRAHSENETRASGTAIYYLLEEGQRSHWHRIDAAEIWHYYAGAPLSLSISEDGDQQSTHILGADIATGERPQIIVPPDAWQSAQSNGAWTLVGCTVSPGFLFDTFEMAAENWAPGPQKDS